MKKTRAIFAMFFAAGAFAFAKEKSNSFFCEAEKNFLSLQNFSQRKSRSQKNPPPRSSELDDSVLENDSEQNEKSSLWQLSLVTDGAYYFKSRPVAGGTHFAPLTNFYDHLEARTTFNAAYKIPTPLGKNFLVQNAAVTLAASFELSPLSAKPAASVAFEPVPFLVFSGGAAAGTGWPLLGMRGLAFLNDKNEYENLVPFKDWIFELWGKATFQFDTGAIFSGDWTHVLLQASCRLCYYGVPSAKKSVWSWQDEINYCSGWRYEANFVLAYQMPLALNMAGVMVDLAGQVNGSDFGRFDKNYNGSFMEVCVSPALKIDFGKKDFIFVLARFKSRRSFEQKYSDREETLFLDFAGREWIFDRIAISWTHLF